MGCTPVLATSTHEPAQGHQLWVLTQSFERHWVPFPVSLSRPAAGLLPSPTFSAKVQGAILSARTWHFCLEVFGWLCRSAPHSRHQDEMKPQKGSLGLSSALGQIGSLQGLVVYSEKATATPSDNTFSSGALFSAFNQAAQHTGGSILQRTAYLGTPLVTGNSLPSLVAQPICSCSRQF